MPKLQAALFVILLPFARPSTARAEGMDEFVYNVIGVAGLAYTVYDVALVVQNRRPDRVVMGTQTAFAVPFALGFTTLVATGSPAPPFIALSVLNSQLAAYGIYSLADRRRSPAFLYLASWGIGGGAASIVAIISSKAHANDAAPQRKGRRRVGWPLKLAVHPLPGERECCSLAISGSF